MTDSDLYHQNNNFENEEQTAEEEQIEEDIKPIILPDNEQTNQTDDPMEGTQLHFYTIFLFLTCINFLFYFD